MGKSPFDRAPIPADLRSVLDALIATAAGTMAGILADSGFGLRASVINVVYGFLQPVFALFADFPLIQLVVAEFVYRIPVVLIVGMLGGLVLRHIRYRLLTLWSIAVWPACLLAGTAIWFFIMKDTAGGDSANGIPRVGSFPELLIYVLQYLLLVLVILAAEAMIVRADRKAHAA